MNIDDPSFDDAIDVIQNHCKDVLGQRRHEIRLKLAHLARDYPLLHGAPVFAQAAEAAARLPKRAYTLEVAAAALAADLHQAFNLHRQFVDENKRDGLRQLYEQAGVAFCQIRELSDMARDLAQDADALTDEFRELTPPPQRGRPRNVAAQTLAHGLGCVWHEYTEKAPCAAYATRDPNARSIQPFVDFVRAFCREGGTIPPPTPDDMQAAIDFGWPARRVAGKPSRSPFPAK